MPASNDNASGPKHVSRPPPSDIRARAPVNRTTLRPNQPLNDASVADEAQRLRKRKLGFGAVAFAIVVVAGSILGARIKEVKQENDRRKDIEAAAQDILVVPDGKPMPLTQSAPNKDLPADPDQKKRMDIAKQIAMLEDRKALLNRYKRNYEGKIRVLQERQAKQAEMDSRRPTEHKNG